MGRRRGSSAFPVARIKKMMQADDDVGKIATATPVLVAKALECMMEHVLQDAASVARARHTRTVTPQHLRHAVLHNDAFDFLRPTLAHVPGLDDALVRPGSQPTVRRQRSKRPRSPPAQLDVHKGVAAPAAPAAPLIDPATAKRQKLPAAQDPLDLSLPVAVPVAISACVAPPVGVPAAPEDDDDDYDDDEEDPRPVASSPAANSAAGNPVGSPPRAMRPPPDDANAASDRVSVHALLS